MSKYWDLLSWKANNAQRIHNKVTKDSITDPAEKAKMIALDDYFSGEKIPYTQFGTETAWYDQAILDVLKDNKTSNRFCIHEEKHPEDTDMCRTEDDIQFATWSVDCLIEHHDCLMMFSYLMDPINLITHLSVLSGRAQRAQDQGLEEDFLVLSTCVAIIRTAIIDRLMFKCGDDFEKI